MAQEQGRCGGSRSNAAAVVSFNSPYGNQQWPSRNVPLSGQSPGPWSWHRGRQQLGQDGRLPSLPCPGLEAWVLILPFTCVSLHFAAAAREALHTLLTLKDSYIRAENKSESLLMIDGKDSGRLSGQVHHAVVLQRFHRVANHHLYRTRRFPKQYELLRKVF